MREAWIQRSYALKDLVAGTIANLFGEISVKSKPIEEASHNSNREAINSKRKSLDRSRSRSRKQD